MAEVLYTKPLPNGNPVVAAVYSKQNYRLLLPIDLNYSDATITHAYIPFLEPLSDAGGSG